MVRKILSKSYLLGILPILVIVLVLIFGHAEKTLTKNNFIPVPTPENRPTETIAQLELTLANHPQNVDILVQLANLYYQSGEFDKSLQTFEKAVELGPNNESALYGLANYYRHRARYAEAEELLKRALVLNPGSDFLHTDLGKLYRNWKKYDLALEMFNKSLEINPNNDQTYSYGMGYLYRDMGLLNKAEESFKKAVEINPQSDFNYMGLGDIYRDMGQYELSEQMFFKSLDLNPLNEARMGLGILYLHQGRLVEAETTLNEYISLLPGRGEVYHILGHVYLQQKRYTQAEEAFKISTQLDPSLGGYTGLGKVYLAIGRHREAYTMFEKELSVNPDSKEAKELLGK